MLGTGYTALTMSGIVTQFAVSMRGGVVTVKADGNALVSGSVTPLANGIVGFSAGTGGQTDAVAIRNVHARFYTCTP